jgi:hypothetical protein
MRVGRALDDAGSFLLRLTISRVWWSGRPMVYSSTSTTQTPPIASARLTNDRETHRSARDNTKYVEPKRIDGL